MTRSTNAFGCSLLYVLKPSKSLPISLINKFRFLGSFLDKNVEGGGIELSPFYDLSSAYLSTSQY
jgi:hypothetical protein